MFSHDALGMLTTCIAQETKEPFNDWVRVNVTNPHEEELLVVALASIAASAIRAQLDLPEDVPCAVAPLTGTESRLEENAQRVVVFMLNRDRPGVFGVIAGVRESGCMGCLANEVASIANAAVHGRIIEEPLS